MALIRIFRTRALAERAKKILAEGGISATVTEDALYGVPIQNYKVAARYRLQVSDEDYYKAARFLANKLMDRK